jgi:SSS family transporter
LISSLQALATSLPTIPATRLHPFDLALIVVYLIGITIFGLRFRKSTAAGAPDRSLKSYFLANNTIPWWAIALSIVSAETSTLTIISIPGVAFAGDFGFLQIVIGYMLGRIVVAALFLPKYFHGEMLTAYQLIDRRFGPTLHKVTAGLFLLTRAAAEGVRVFAVSIVVGIAIGTNDTLSIAIISFLTLLYTFEGGMTAVIWTDVVQMAIYIGGTLVAISTLGTHVPGGWQHIHAVTSAAHKLTIFHFAFNLTQSYTFWAGLLGGTFLTMASHGTDQLMVQRMLAARNLRESRIALLSSGVVIFFQFTLFLLIGAGLYVFYNLHPQIFSSPDRIFPTFIVQQMPIGIAGLLVAAILAAAMSNLSAALNSLSSTTVVDFYMHWRPQADDRERMLISRSSTVLWAFVLFAIAIYSVHAGGKGHVVETGLSIASVAYGCLLGVFLLGTLTKYATQTGTIIGMITGFTLNVYLWQGTFPVHLGPIAIPHIAFTWYVLIGAIVTFAIGSLASLIFHKQSTHKAVAAALILSLSLTHHASAQTAQTRVPHLRDGLIVAKVGIGEADLSSAASSPQTSKETSAAPTRTVPLSEVKLPEPASALASRYPKASALGLSPLAENAGLQPLGYALVQSATNPVPATLDFAPIDTLLNTTNKTNTLATVSEANHRAQHDPEGAGGFSPTNTASMMEGLQPRALSSPSQAPKSTTSDFTPISSLINNAIAAHKIPGAVVVIGHNGKIDFEQAYGARKLAGEPGPFGTAAEPMTEDTIFDMASLTKVLVTTTAIMQLYELHKLDVDDPVAKYLPDFAVNGKEKITIRELLTHYSGLPEDVDLKDHWGLTAPDKAEGIRRALASSLVATPGTHFEYSDINFITLGALVEKLSGQPLYAYAQQHIFAPLDMIRTEYHPFETACGPKLILGSAITLPLPTKPPGSKVKPYFCPSPQTWMPVGISWNIAPTAHDDEGTPATNPDFDHLLRGTVHDPTTRRMGGVAGDAGVFSTAHDISLFAQALLDKLLHNTGPFPLQQSTLQLMTRPQQPPTAQSGATIFTTDGQTTKGIATRGFGWDINSAFSRPRGEVFPIAEANNPGSFGHTGFTGTSLWIDPTSNTYVILLSNAIHPRGAAPISVLRGEVATAAALAIGLPRPCVPCRMHTTCPCMAAPTATLSSPETRPPATLTGIDTLEATRFAALASAAARHHNTLRLGLLTNQTGLDAMHRRTIDILFNDAPKAVPGLRLTTLFSPEHGILGAADTEHIGNEIDPATHLPVISLYGPKDADKRPKPDDLRNLDAVVIDLQDAGVRFYTYESVVGYFLEAAAQNHIEVIVLDRPNLLGGEKVQGPVSDPDLSSYTAYMPLPIRHGLTLGELARYINGENRRPSPTSPNMFLPLSAQLTVVPMQYWRRSMYFDNTGLLANWINPSPNLRNLTAATLYPGVALLETTNVSVGRGTDKPFEQFGACWPPIKPPSRKAPPRTTCAPEDQIDGPALAAYLTARHIPGVAFAPTTFTVAEDSNHYPFHGLTIHGVSLTLTDRNLLDSPELGIELISALHNLYPTRFDLARTNRLIANVNTMQSLTANEDPRKIAAAWATDLNDFQQRRKPYLLYP